MESSFLKMFYSDIKAMGISHTQRKQNALDIDEDVCEYGDTTIPSLTYDVIELQTYSLLGHLDQITCIMIVPNEPNIILSGSRDSFIFVWDINDNLGGNIKSRLIGHSAVVSDIDVSLDGKYAISASYDGTLKLWQLDSATCNRTFIGHLGSIFAVAFSPDNRQIISCGEDRTLKIWNTIGVCKKTVNLDSCASCISFSPNPDDVLFMTGDKNHNIKMWKKDNMYDNQTLFDKKHKKQVTSIIISPDGSLCATADANGTIHLWGIDDQRAYWSMDEVLKCKINDVIFSPTRYWMCAAVADSVLIWDLETKQIVAQLRCNSYGAKEVQCKCIQWNQTGEILFVGCSDNTIKIWKMSHNFDTIQEEVVPVVEDFDMIQEEVVSDPVDDHAGDEWEVAAELEQW